MAEASPSRPLTALPSPSARRKLAFPVVLLAALALACCPTPTATSLETSFAAEVVSVSLPTARARLTDGRLVELSFTRALAEIPRVGERIYVEGRLENDLVLVRRVVSL